VRRTGRRRPRAVITVVAAALGLAGCGVGAGPGLSRGVTLRVSAGFGSGVIRSLQAGHPPQGDSVMALTEKYTTVAASDGGGFVDAIDGHANHDSGATKLDWFFYVNGIEATVGATETKLAAGDRVWWDLHDWRATDSVPAVVGSFPAPFTDGADGSENRTTVQCAQPRGLACRSVLAALKHAGVKAVVTAALSPLRLKESVTVLVGTDAQLAETAAGTLLDGAPSASGVYARFADGGRALELENPGGHDVDTLYGGTGLIAAVVPSGGSLPVWLVTGTTAAGVQLAAGDLSAATLAGHFAIAVSGGGVLALPQSPQS
jgi:hypothetical protein